MTYIILKHMGKECRDVGLHPLWGDAEGIGRVHLYALKDHHISASTIDRLRKNKPLRTTTLNDLRRILNCPIEQILCYIPSETDQKL